MACPAACRVEMLWEEKGVWRWGNPWPIRCDSRKCMCCLVLRWDNHLQDEMGLDHWKPGWFQVAAHIVTILRFQERQLQKIGAEMKAVGIDVLSSFLGFQDVSRCYDVQQVLHSPLWTDPCLTFKLVKTMLNHNFRPLKTNRVWYFASLFFLQSGEKKNVARWNRMRCWASWRPQLRGGWYHYRQGGYCLVVWRVLKGVLILP
jgi:hypothetical protein